MKQHWPRIPEESGAYGLNSNCYALRNGVFVYFVITFYTLGIVIPIGVGPTVSSLRAGGGGGPRGPVRGALGVALPERGCTTVESCSRRCPEGGLGYDVRGVIQLRAIPLSGTWISRLQND